MSTTRRATYVLVLTDWAGFRSIVGMDAGWSRSTAQAQADAARAADPQTHIRIERWM